ncbi:hypothetical protein E2C01_023897 [Portunus trituberculatus]|uniref:Uncharacterized protein n=1 Tax=Portunus trituberculatus TaxID=210409 RepID=A0A5B7EBA4_PORTR|nr:hypothetical protein [Portunus trituberculatus]
MHLPSSRVLCLTPNGGFEMEMFVKEAILDSANYTKRRATTASALSLEEDILEGSCLSTFTSRQGTN